MALRELKPGIQYSEGRSLPWSGASLINCFSEQSDGDRTSVYAVLALPGLDLFSSNGNQPVRGIHRMVNTLYAVVGSTLYRIASDGTSTSLGTIDGSIPTRIADNGTQLAIHGGFNGQTGYIYDSTTNVLTTSPTNLPAVSDVAFIDGYFVWTVANSDQFVISGLNDGLSYDPLDVATVEGAPDNLVGVVNDHRELQFYGTDTVEIWYNSGAADFPFERQGNAFIERGCIDKDSIVKIDNSVHFVGDDRFVYRLDGYNPVRISNTAIEFKIESASYYRSFTYSQEGHKFYCLGTDSGTFCYDMSTGAWHERRSFNLNNYRVGSATTAYGKIIFGDAYTGNLYVPSLTSYTENGDIIPIQISLPTLTNSRERATLYRIDLYCETGVGNSDDPDPQVMMQYSRDGGRTWSNEMWRSLGVVGDYLHRAVWRPNVQFRQLQIKFMMPSRTRRLVMGQYADIR